MSYVYLKTKANSESLTTNVIPLKVTSIGISVDKTIPSMPVPISGLTFGEATVAALDAGMSRKSMSIQGFILPESITKDGAGGHDKGALNYTAHEIAQMISSGVDSTGAAQHQAFDELVFLIPSTVNENFVDRGKLADSPSDPSASSLDNGTLQVNIPWTFASRGGANELDNYRVPFPNDFPTSETSEGVKGFIRQFNCDFTSDTVEVSFNMTFEVATVFP